MQIILFCVSCGCTISQRVRCWLLTAEPWVQSWVTYDIHGGWSGNGTGRSSFFSSFSLSIILPRSTSIYHCLLTYMIDLTKQYINTSLIFKPQASSLIEHSAGYRVRRCFMRHVHEYHDTHFFKFPLDLCMKLNVATLAVCWISLQGTAANKNLLYKADCGTDMKQISKSMEPL